MVKRINRQIITYLHFNKEPKQYCALFRFFIVYFKRANPAKNHYTIDGNREQIKYLTFIDQRGKLHLHV
ncbi:hypothetical protein LOOC260_116810 [Paucilactobacillus hokkaidonensis JCM 18461]|uniref:Uncharacterized protein n=1 Tax=Paucilactobacillus hokkaidonensis JCM 18461 TaxID=1291742 RepID=A0A0A1GVD1_9LACO|nr:hypothetical protein LOOC260_116810 [Paucilactobacillus hokkaidonensis JCM 18461]